MICEESGGRVTDIKNVFSLFGMGEAKRIEQIKNAEDGSLYDVWRVTSNGAEFVLKKAKGKEKAIYRSFFPRAVSGVPRCFGSVSAFGCDYLLLSFLRGEGLLRLDRDSARAAIDALADIQNEFWGDTLHSDDGVTFEKAYGSCEDRGKYLYDSALEKCHARYLELYSTIPRTLCHGDMLPFNVLYDGERAYIVDWEQAGILPYPVSFARLIAHCFQGEDEFFYMTDADKEFAIGYYYERFVKEKGVDEREYRRTLEYFIFYEYCEWVMLGNKYEDSDKARFDKYFALAKALAEKLNNE